MSELPRRFPRTSLVQAAALLESRIQALMDETYGLMALEDAGLSEHQLGKLDLRLKKLDEARVALNTARQALWLLP